MNSEQEQALFGFLASIGFKGADLERSIKENVALNLPGFTVRHEIKHGEETMFYDLKFIKDSQFNSYRVSEYKATHRKEILIDHKLIDGVDTAVLEDRFKQSDWRSYFDTNRITSEKDEAFIRETMKMLDKLIAGADREGTDIGERLRFKYWPQKHSDRRDLRQTYEHSYDFVAGEFGLCNANLAFYHQSGRFSDLHEKLDSLLLDKYTSLDLYPLLEKFLSKDPESFTLTGVRNNHEGYGTYSVPVVKADGWHETEEYTLSLTLYPQIEHGLYNGVDSFRLEKTMQQIDWQNDRDLISQINGQELEFPEQVTEVFLQIEELKKSNEGVTIAQQLELKYFIGTSFLDAMIDQKTWDYLGALPKINWTLPCDIDAGIAWNLLCGRAVREDVVFKMVGQSDDWVRLERHGKDVTINDGFQTVGTFSRSDLESTLDQLPIYRVHYRDTIPRLERGDLADVSLKNETRVLLEVSPEKKTIDIYTPLKQYIPVNISFDPNWQPQDQNLKQSEKRPRQKPVPKHKPRW